MSLKNKRFTITELPIKGAMVVKRNQIGDERGFLSRLFCAEELTQAGWNKPIMQINHTLTEHAGTVRGIHYQNPPYTEMKLVTCVRGEVWDVAVDLRQGSPTFLKWHAELLSAENGRALLIPEGFGHGFQTMTDNCELVYLHSEKYNSEAEAALRFEDPKLAIKWPLQIEVCSERDRSHPLIDINFEGIVL
ncbi:MAG: dTDP-4-dehydrorhamnose 3,5-epimerase [Bacteroidetes bacterium]|nr:dTDP-4-dehydrorhamnose 3,5-epimerase [Bacteroidota bacterium]